MAFRDRFDPDPLLATSLSFTPGFKTSVEPFLDSAGVLSTDSGREDEAPFDFVDIADERIPSEGDVTFERVFGDVTDDLSGAFGVEATEREFGFGEAISVFDTAADFDTTGASSSD